MTPLTILWRGPLESCNYACSYCPFAKRSARRDVLDRDRAAVERFVQWVASHRQRQLAILFTPWGEGLVHAWYRRALSELSRMPQVQRVGIQTNGSTSMEWVDEANRERLALWITWHPTEVALEQLLAQVNDLRRRDVRFSVGAVAVPAHLPLVERLRAALPADVPCWVNALQPHGRYTPDEVARWTAIDPQFPLSVRPHASRGKRCRTGDSAITVDGDGAIRRCHFVDEVLGNLFSDDLDQILRPRPCPRAQCACYIGYAHLEHLRLDTAYGDDLLFRIPVQPTA